MDFKERGIVVLIKPTSDPREVMLTISMLDPNKRLRKIITQTNNQLKEGEWIEFYKDVDGSPKWQKLSDKVLPTKVQRDKNGKVDVYVKTKVVPTNEQIEWTGTHPLAFKEKNFCIGFSREVGRVLIAFENEFPKHCLLECWVGTLLHYPDGNQYQHLAQLNAVSWAMSSKMKEDLRYVKKVEAISQKFPFVNGVVVKKSDENFYAWNWDYGLCTVPRSLFQDADVDLGSWLYFSPITLDKRTKEDLLQSVAIFVSVSESDIYETTIKGGQIYIKHTIEVPFQNHENSTRTYRINVIGRINDASSLVLSRHEGKKLEVISKCIFLEGNQVNWIISSVNDNEEVSIPFQKPILQQPSKPKNVEPKDFYLFGSTSKEAKKFYKSACTSITGVIYGEYRSLFYVYSDAAILGNNPIVKILKRNLGISGIRVGDWLSIDLDRSLVILSASKIEPKHETRICEETKNGIVLTWVEIKVIVERDPLEKEKRLLKSYITGKVIDNKLLFQESLPLGNRLLMWCKRIDGLKEYGVGDIYWAVSDNPEPEKVQEGFGSMAHKNEDAHNDPSMKTHVKYRYWTTNEKKKIINADGEEISQDEEEEEEEEFGFPELEDRPKTPIHKENSPVPGPSGLRRSPPLSRSQSSYGSDSSPLQLASVNPTKPEIRKRPPPLNYSDDYVQDYNTQPRHGPLSYHEDQLCSEDQGDYMYEDNSDVYNLYGDYDNTRQRRRPTTLRPPSTMSWEEMSYGYYGQEESDDYDDPYQHPYSQMDQPRNYRHHLEYMDYDDYGYQTNFPPRPPEYKPMAPMYPEYGPMVPRYLIYPSPRQQQQERYDPYYHQHIQHRRPLPSMYKLTNRPYVGPSSGYGFVAPPPSHRFMAPPPGYRLMASHPGNGLMVRSQPDYPPPRRQPQENDQELFYEQIHETVNQPSTRANSQQQFQESNAESFHPPPNHPLSQQKFQKKSDEIVHQPATRPNRQQFQETSAEIVHQPSTRPISRQPFQEPSAETVYPPSTRPISRQQFQETSAEIVHPPSSSPISQQQFQETNYNLEAQGNQEIGYDDIRLYTAEEDWAGVSRRALRGGTPGRARTPVQTISFPKRSFQQAISKQPTTSKIDEVPEAEEIHAQNFEHNQAQEAELQERLKTLNIESGHSSPPEDPFQIPKKETQDIAQEENVTSPAVVQKRVRFAEHNPIPEEDMPPEEDVHYQEIAPEEENVQSLVQDQKDLRFSTDKPTHVPYEEEEEEIDETPDSDFQYVGVVCTRDYTWHKECYLVYCPDLSNDAYVDRSIIGTRNLGLADWIRFNVINENGWSKIIKFKKIDERYPTMEHRIPKDSRNRENIPTNTIKFLTTVTIPHDYNRDRYGGKIKANIEEFEGKVKEIEVFDENEDIKKGHIGKLYNATILKCNEEIRGTDTRWKIVRFQNPIGFSPILFSKKYRKTIGKSIF